MDTDATLLIKMTTERTRRIRAAPDASQSRAGVVKRSLSIAGHATSISLEEPFWHALKALASGRNISLAMLVAEVDGKRGRTNLSSALRVHVLECLMAQAGALRHSAGPESAD